MLSLQENKKTWFDTFVVSVSTMRGGKNGVMLCQEMDARKVLFYYDTRLLARQSSLITPLVSWVDKVHASTIGV
jgi:hypothetical protein